MAAISIQPSAGVAAYVGQGTGGVGAFLGDVAKALDDTEDESRPQFDNGSGLSRQERITAAQLTRLLQYAWVSPLMPEFIASLPVTGIDGTARRTGASPGAAGLAHLKTGSLRDVAGVAGYVHAADGRRYVLVAIANHPDAGAIRPVVDALVAWAAGGAGVAPTASTSTARSRLGPP